MENISVEVPFKSIETALPAEFRINKFEYGDSLFSNDNVHNIYYHYSLVHANAESYYISPSGMFYAASLISLKNDKFYDDILEEMYDKQDFFITPWSINTRIREDEKLQSIFNLNSDRIPITIKCRGVEFIFDMPFDTADTAPDTAPFGMALPKMILITFFLFFLLLSGIIF